MIVLYILLGISILAPIYTYAVYPFVLRLFKPKSRETRDNYMPSTSVLIVEDNEEICRSKVKNVRESSLQNLEDVVCISNQQDAAVAIKNLKGEVVVVTDGYSLFLKDTISNVIQTLSSDMVGCVCGMVRKAPDENGESRDGANWKYENKIKVLESNIGCLSGANTAIYAFKKECVPEHIDKKINLDFYIPTSITENGYDVLFEPKSVAYEEERTEQDLFKKHIADGASGYRSIVRFWRLLLPHKGSFVFWSHRVMKWLVPFNMLFLLFGCGILAPQYKWALVLFVVQLLFYVYVIVYYILYTLKGKDMSGPIGKLSGFASYFVVLNFAWLSGLFKR